MKKREIKHLGYRCLGPTITPKKIEGLKEGLKKDIKLSKTKKYFSVLAGTTRLNILYLLNQENRLCVCDLADILDTTISATSHQLKILRQSKLVKTTKDGQTVYYFLSDHGTEEAKKHF